VDLTQKYLTDLRAFVGRLKSLLELFVLVTSLFSLFPFQGCGLRENLFLAAMRAFLLPTLLESLRVVVGADVSGDMA
jgi:hypothetical protein